jgi:hypothetical protein
MPAAESGPTTADTQRYTWEAASWVTGVPLKTLRHTYRLLLPAARLPSTLTMEEIYWLAFAAEHELSKDT